ncbi:MAG: galactose mutarotase [Acetatifactor sp.]|nr:galactose mutarotase [Acetatifactor sp.]
MAIETSVFGKYPDGRDIMLYTISNSKGMQAAVSNLGAAIVKLMVPDSKGQVADVVLGYDKGEDYLENSCFFGVVIGPSANRISNAAYQIDSVTYHVDVNDGVNNLHSHMDKGYHKLLWDAEIHDNSVTFKLEDTDGNLGFPGNKKISLTYTLDEENALKLHYHGTSDKKTILNLTNHTYFNLDGHDSGKMVEHELWMAASNYTPAGPGCIPTGEVTPVSGSPMDFTTSKKISKDIQANTEQLQIGNGYDHNWVIDGWDGTLRHFATVKAPVSGRVMKAYTTLPGVQFYAGNSISEHTGKDGAAYSARVGLCLETQYFPDSVNKPQFPSCIFGGDREYDSVTIYQFE